MFKMSQSDQKIIDRITLRLGMDPRPIDGWPLSGSGKIPIQFPPKIKSKSKNAIWDEIDVTSYEPIAIWSGAQASKISMELKYVVTGGKYGQDSIGNGGANWTVDKISRTIRMIMGYFYRSMPAVMADGVKVPTLQMIIYDVCPKGANGSISTWRIENASVAYGDEIVSYQGREYHQVSTVTMNLAMVTRISDQNGENSQMEIDAPKFPANEWY